MANYFLRFPRGLERCLTFSYDDGNQADRRLLDIFNKHGVKGTFNLNAGNMPQNPTEGSWHISKSEIKELYKGHEIATHGYTHPLLETLTLTDMTRELLLDRIELEKITGDIIKGHAYPYGKPQGIDKELDLALTACGIDYARMVHTTHGFGIPTSWFNWHPTCHHADEHLMALADKFLEYPPKNNSFRKEPYLFYVWGHSFEFNSADNWDVIEKFLDKVAGKDNVWYATNGEVFAYVKAYNSLIWNAEKTRVYNPTATTLYFASLDKSYKINPNEALYI